MLTGGKRPPGMPKGFFVEPTVFAGPNIRSCTVWREEACPPSCKRCRASSRTDQQLRHVRQCGALHSSALGCNRMHKLSSQPAISRHCFVGLQGLLVSFARRPETAQQPDHVPDSSLGILQRRPGA